VGSKKQKARKEHEINKGKKKNKFQSRIFTNWTFKLDQIHSLFLTKNSNNNSNNNNNNNNVKKGPIQGLNLLPFDPWDFGPWTII